MKAEGRRMNGRSDPEDLRRRTKRFGLAIVSLYTRIPNSPPAQVIGRQMLRSGTSVGAHYREACRARSDAEFISKLEGGLQELDETGYWLELLIESGLFNESEAHRILAETDELIRIFVTIVRGRKGDGG
jgi:four helix bundle protein